MSKNPKSTAETRKSAPVRKSQSGSDPKTSASIPALNKEKPASIKAGPDHERQKTGTTNFTFYTNPILTLVCVPPDAPVLFSLEEASDLTGVHPEMLLYYARAGLIEVRRGELGTALFFDETALHEIRRIEHYRRHLGVGRRALPLICELQREGARQQIELHFLRYP